MASIAEGIEAAPATLAPGGRWAVVERIGTRLTAGLAAIQAALLVVTLALMLVSIVMRYAVNHSLASGEDLEVFLFTWLIFLGIPRTLWRDE
ncbi:MAG: TRAP transporter small permease subunit, partial [Pseudonocardia sp.]|nr:TRAP transporter small permease subunit [Pseudonocardia sp.]